MHVWARVRVGKGEGGVRGEAGQAWNLGVNFRIRLLNSEIFI